MNQETAPESKSTVMTIAPLPSARMETVSSATPDRVGGAAINFHTAEFNRRDGLDDYSGDYHSFQPLGDVITADMRHQIERGLGETDADSSPEDRKPAEKKGTEGLTVVALESAPPLTVVSQGRILVIDTNPERVATCGKLLSEQGLTCTLLVMKSGPTEFPSFRFGRLAPLEVSALSITGAFCAFSATVTIQGEQTPLSACLGSEAAIFDLVLDLQVAPSFAGGRLPLGYYAPGPNPVHLKAVMAELPEMKGRFTKPQFTVFLKDRCLHGRSQNCDCRLCLETCPSGAIKVENKQITINQYLCQGCGGCALVCSADAIRMVHPSREELLSELMREVARLSAEAVFPPILVISEGKYDFPMESPGTEDGGADRIIDFNVEQIGLVGLEMLLTALAYGAGQVVVVCGPQNPSTIREAVKWQTQQAVAILQGLGMRSDKIRFVVVPSENCDPEITLFPAPGINGQPDRSPMTKAVFSSGLDKRTLVRLATQYLYDQSDLHKSWLSLPAGSPFGSVIIDTHCTMCMACAVTCPTGALSAGGAVPRLEFLESLCHQCGFCEKTCPEGAISLLPRVSCDPKIVENTTMLNEIEPFRCIECGVPFASPAMVNRMQNKLAGHWMYGDERQLRRLQMCRTCRTRDALGSQDMKLWNRQ